MSPDAIHWSAHATVEKFDEEDVEFVRRLTGVPNPGADLLAASGVTPYEVVESDGNLLTTAGLTRLTALLIASGSPQALTNTACRIGVGDGTGSAAVGDTDLGAGAGSTHRQFNVMEATYPSVSSGVVTFKSSYATGEANFAWNEWGVDVGTPTVTAGTTVNACFFNHKTSAALGTKSSGTWVLTVTITIS